MKIYAPVKDFNGWRNNIRFTNGVGETEDTRVIEWFEKNGYFVEKLVEKREEIVEQTVEPCDEPIEQVEQVEADFYSMTPNEIREWMKMNGYGTKMKNIRSKEKLIEIIRG